jgi:hypothetical protein
LSAAGTPTQVPEPATLALLGVGLAGSASRAASSKSIRCTHGPPLRRGFFVSMRRMPTGGCPDPQRTPIASPALITTARRMIAPCSTPPTRPNPELVYANYLKTWAMLGIEPHARERALGLNPGANRGADAAPGAHDALASQVTSAYRAGNKSLPALSTRRSRQEPAPRLMLVRMRAG